MVIDATMWFAEADALRLRLTMLNGLVDRFVVVEADRTHTGLPKGWLLPDEFRDHPKVVYWPVESEGSGAWQREGNQRRAMRDAVASLNPDGDTTVVMSDCDEIWDERLLAADGVRVAGMDFRMFDVGWQYPTVWCGSIAGPWSEMRSRDWNGLRGMRWNLPLVLSGWHLSWMGDDDQARAKQQAFAHEELADADILGEAARGRWVSGQRLKTDAPPLPDGLLAAVPASWKARRVS